MKIAFVEVAGFRSNTAPRLIDVGDFFIDLGDIADLIRKDITQIGEYDIPSFVPPDEIHADHVQGNGNANFPPVSKPVPFGANFDDEDPDADGDFVRIRD